MANGLDCFCKSLEAVTALFLNSKIILNNNNPEDQILGINAGPFSVISCAPGKKLLL
nr:hypothetical protein [Polaribacter filamentus]